jgi:hypothetical protein
MSKHFPPASFFDSLLVFIGIEAENYGQDPLFVFILLFELPSSYLFKVSNRHV